MDITLYSLLSWFSATLILGLGFIIYYLSPLSRSARLFSLLAFSVSMWSFSIPINSSLATRLSFFLATTITTIFFIFSSSYPQEYKINKKLLIILLSIEILFAYIIFFTDLIISRVILIPNTDHVIWSYGPIWFIFDFYICTCWLAGIIFIFNRFLKTKEKVLRTNLKFMLIALIVGIIPPLITGVLLPRIGIFDYYWLAPTSGLIWLLVIAYAITRHHLFNIKVLTVELITFSLWTFILIRTIISKTVQDMAIEGGLLFISVILGVILIKSVLREKEQHEQIERLMADVQTAYQKVKESNENLEQKINAQTKDVRRAYEVEKLARAELEELNKTKDEFITSTQHHLRTPLTSLKWGLESIRSGTGGPVTPELKDILDNADSSMDQMSETIENFIHITEKKV
jgi:hypothetical protein